MRFSELTRRIDHLDDTVAELNRALTKKKAKKVNWNNNFIIIIIMLYNLNQTFLCVQSNYNVTVLLSHHR